MGLADLVDQKRTILMEGALGERLKREYHIRFDEYVAMAGLIYSLQGMRALSELWKGYIDIAGKYHFPLLVTTPTRRANCDRITASRFSEKLFTDNVRFLRNIQRNSGIEMYVGGLMGCRGDAYTAEGALSEVEAYAFHSWTAEHFLEAGADFLYAGIMPSLPEAAGLARAADGVNLPYIISFTVQADGRLIDGTTISDAIRYIDEVTGRHPLCYMANCVHPRILRKALMQPFNRTEQVQRRFLGIQANTSPLSYAELDGAKELQCSEPESFAEEMMLLQDAAPIQIWGGCCGTDHRHMECVAQRLSLRR